MTSMHAKLMESSSQSGNEEQVYTDSILEFFGSAEKAKDAYMDYLHVRRAMGDKHDITLTASHIDNYERWSDASKKAKAAALGGRTTTGDEYFQVTFDV